MTSLRKLAEQGKAVRTEYGYKLNVEYLRFNSENLRTAYGFRPGFDSERCLDLIKSQINVLEGAPCTLSEDDKKYLLDGANNSEEGQDTIGWLTSSVIENGVKSPIRGLWDSDKEEFTTTDGNRRLASIILARLQGKTIYRVPISLEESKNDLEILLTQITANGAKQYEPVELGKIFNQMVKYGLTITEISAKTAFSVPVIQSRLQLLELPLAQQQLVEQKLVTPTAILQINKEAAESGVSSATVTEALKEAVQFATNDGKNKATLNKIKETLKKKTEKPFDRTSTIAKAQDLIGNLSDIDLEEIQDDELKEFVKVLDKAYKVLGY